MKITILNGNADEKNEVFDLYVKQLKDGLERVQHDVTNFTLREMKINYCTGCFGCWVKNPGECIFDDDARQICRTEVASDVVLLAAPIKMGYPDQMLKKMLDKTIPILMPYFDVVNGEAHHMRRYEKYPKLGLLLAREADTDEEDLRLIKTMFQRLALNMRSHLDHFMLTDLPVEENAAIISRMQADNVQLPKAPTATRGVRITPPSRLTVFNGSPRGKSGNTPLLLQQFIEGFESSIPHKSHELYHLNRTRDMDTFVDAFENAECVLLGFPLYTDAMPGIVKAFIDRLEPFVGRVQNPPIGFLVQSGFPESAHSRYVERYLEKLARRLGSPYLGTIVKGGGEGLRMMPENMNRKLFDAVRALGRNFGESGMFDASLLKKIAGRENYPGYMAPVFKLLSKTPLLNFYWNMQLKENGVYDKRFARPYGEGS